MARVLFIVLWVVCLPLFGEELPPLRIGSLIDGPSRYLEGQRDLFEFEIVDLLGGEYEVRFPRSGQIEGEWTSESLSRGLGQLLADPEIDLILVVGLLGGHVAAVHGDLTKPVVASSMWVELLPPGKEHPPNLVYVGSPLNLARDFDFLHQLIPFHRMAILVDRELYTQLHLSRSTLDPYRQRYGAEFDLILMDENPVEALDQLSPETDLVYLTPPFRSSSEELRQLIEELNRRRLPTFSMVGEEEVREGAMLGLVPSSDLPRLGRRVALDVQRILFGEEASSIPTELGIQTRPSFNLGTAAIVGYSPPWWLLMDATLFGEQEKSSRLTLCSAIQWVLSVNPEVLAARYLVQAGCGDVGIARSRLLPQIGTDLIAQEIDKARARESLGRHPQRIVEAGASVEQSIWSDRRWANYQIERWLQMGRVADCCKVSLDVVFEVGTAYITLLLRKSLVLIEQQNLEITRQNLRYAGARVEIGTSKVTEIYRWESQLETDKRAVVGAQAQVQIAEAELNRLLHRSPLCPLYMDERTIADLLQEVEQSRLTSLIQTPQLFDWFTEFEIYQGWCCSPELQEIRAAIRAQSRQLLADERAYWAPDFDFIGETQQRVVRGGVGVGAGEFAPLVGDRAEVNDWMVALRATFPLFEGGAKRARVRRDCALLQELREEWQRVADLVSRNVAIALDRGLASFLSIDLAAKALEAANLNLAFVEEEYAKGTASILDSLDAQRTALDAARANVITQANFVLDLVLLGRAIGRFDFLCSSEARNRWFSQLNHFIGEKERCRCD